MLGDIPSLLVRLKCPVQTGARSGANPRTLMSSYQGRKTNILGWFQALMPREERFFTLFERHATIVVAGATALQGLLCGGDDVASYCEEIFRREAEADEVAREVLQAVRRTFITPFDRTDI
jgi:hypothetical protein